MFCAQWALHGACKHASAVVCGLLAHSRHHHLGRACTRMAAQERYSTSSGQDDCSDDTGSEPRKDADPTSGGTLPPPPPQWHKRGTWIDPQTIERRMMNDDEAEEPAAAKEPETDVGKSITAIIRVGPCTEWLDQCSHNSCHNPAAPKFQP